LKKNHTRSFLFSRSRGTVFLLAICFVFFWLQQICAPVGSVLDPLLVSLVFKQIFVVERLSRQLRFPGTWFQICVSPCSIFVRLTSQPARFVWLSVSAPIPSSTAALFLLVRSVGLCFSPIEIFVATGSWLGCRLSLIFLYSLPVLSSLFFLPLSP
jgi:hypothetical protein